MSVSIKFFAESVESVGKFNTFEQRQNNFDEIESRMFNKRFGT